MTAYSTLHVDLDAYAHNLRHIRSLVSEDCGLIAVVKADGYGHTMIPISERAVEEGVAMLAVATVDEGVYLRSHFPEMPILVLYQPPVEALNDVIAQALRVTLNECSLGERLGDLARKAQVIVPVHCEVDTGMGRQGFGYETAVKDVQALTRISNIDVEAIMTHFPSAEIADDPFTQNQIKAFRNLLRDVGRAGVPYEISHASNSAGVVNYPAANFDMARVGLMTYGVWPTDTPPETSSLRPVARWESRVAFVRTLPGGASVGYGRTHRTQNPTEVATVLVGYGDGYTHHLSNTGEVLIRGVRCPVIGRVSMDAITVDVSGLREVAAGDRVTLIGADGEEIIRVEDLARWANTIPYEILTEISPRVERRIHT